MELWWGIALCGAFALSIFCVPLIVHAAARFGVIDIPGGIKKLHTQPTPLLGGIAPFIGFAVTVLLVLFFTHHFTSGTLRLEMLLGFLLSCTILIIGGILDDRYNLSPVQAIISPLLAALVAVLVGMGVTKVTNPFGAPLVIGPLISGIFTFAWLMGVTYTTKFLDGVDGLVTTLGIIGAGMVAGLALTEKFYQPDVALLALIFAAALLGFLLWNAPPAQIFLGEGGSTFIGFTLGTLAVIGGSKFATLLFIVGLPALDAAFVIIRRLMLGRSPFHGGDGLHFHYELRQVGWTSRQIVLLYGSVALLFGVTSLVFSSWQKIFALVILAILSLFAMLWVAKKQHHL